MERLKSGYVPLHREGLAAGQELGAPEESKTGIQISNGRKDVQVDDVHGWHE